MKLIVKCAGCGKIMRIEEDDRQDEGEVISHSICPSCKANILEDTDIVKEKVVDVLNRICV